MLKVFLGSRFLGHVMCFIWTWKQKPNSNPYTFKHKVDTPMAMSTFFVGRDLSLAPPWRRH